ncbi:MAG: hypothetical protein J0I21_16860 [Alphaproteobacteria bacterium]|nr:hypothetical protein [Alphaproteobacteria bacterium]
MSRRAPAALVLLAVLAACPPGFAQTPWVLLARRALGKVQQLTQDQNGKTPGFEVATVLLDAPAARVYATAVAMVRRNQAVQIVGEDPAHYRLQIAQGPRQGSLSVTPLGENLSQIMIAANVIAGQDSTASRMTDAVLRVCREMHKQCSVTQ